MGRWLLVSAVAEYAAFAAREEVHPRKLCGKYSEGGKLRNRVSRFFQTSIKTGRYSAWIAATTPAKNLSCGTTCFGVPTPLASIEGVSRNRWPHFRAEDRNLFTRIQAKTVRDYLLPPCHPTAQASRIAHKRSQFAESPAAVGWQCLTVIGSAQLSSIVPLSLVRFMPRVFIDQEKRRDT